MEGKSSLTAWRRFDHRLIRNKDRDMGGRGWVQPPHVHGRRNSQFGGAFINGGATSLRATPFNDLSCTRRDVRSPFAGQSSTSSSGPFSLLHLPPAADRWEVQMEAQMLHFNLVTVCNCIVPLLVERRLPPLRVGRIIKLDISISFLLAFRP